MMRLTTLMPSRDVFSLQPSCRYGKCSETTSSINIIIALRIGQEICLRLPRMSGLSERIHQKRAVANMTKFHEGLTIPLRPSRRISSQVR